MEGDLVFTPTELVSAQFYVAAHKEKFKMCNYLGSQNINPNKSNLNRNS